MYSQKSIWQNVYLESIGTIPTTALHISQKAAAGSQPYSSTTRIVCHLLIIEGTQESKYASLRDTY